MNEQKTIETTVISNPNLTEAQKREGGLPTTPKSGSLVTVKDQALNRMFAERLKVSNKPTKE